MSDAANLDSKKLLEESLSMPGALGAISYAVLKGLLAGGAKPDVVAGVRILMQKHFVELADGDCNALCEVVHTRLRDGVNKGGKWY